MQLYAASSCLRNIVFTKLKTAVTVVAPFTHSCKLELSIIVSAPAYIIAFINYNLSLASVACLLDIKDFITQNAAKVLLCSVGGVDIQHMALQLGN